MAAAKTAVITSPVHLNMRSTYPLRIMQEKDLLRVLAVDDVSYPFAWTLGIFKDCLRVNYACWVMEFEGEIQGYFVIHKIVDEAHLLNICIHPDLQGNGLGKMLLDKALLVATEIKCSSMFLEVRPSNKAALAIYDQYGFGEIGRRNNYYPAEKGREDAIVMAKELLIDQDFDW